MEQNFGELGHGRGGLGTECEEAANARQIFGAQLRFERSIERGLAYIDLQTPPIVLKADGLA